MRIGLQTWGTEGDFNPFLALAIGLQNAGHQVTLAYTSIDGKDYTYCVENLGIEVIKANGSTPISSDFNPYAIDAHPGSFREYTELLNRYFEPLTDAMYEASEKLCQKNDLVIGHAVCHTLLTASQKYKKPRMALVLTPLVIRSKHVSPIGIHLGTTINSFLWKIGGFIATQSWFKRAREIRKRESLPAVKSLQKEMFTSDLLTIVAASESLVPRPNDWPETVQMTGFLDLPSNRTVDELPSDLTAFLKSGQAPLFITFGSCMQYDLLASTQLIVEAAKLSGRRAIIQSDWEKVTKTNDPNILCIGPVQHSLVFPHCSIIVHHCGAGTTQAAVLAGKPSVVVAHGFDQAYWGNLVEKVGIGRKALNRSSISAKKLAQVINEAFEDESLRTRSKQIGDQMKIENGVATALELIEKSAK
ncbi:MAG: hypothetical protein RL266_876 [Bacteroidota bacterium]